MQAGQGGFVIGFGYTRGRAVKLRVGMVIFVFDTHHANNIPTDSPEHGDHHGTLGMHRACIKHELPTSEGTTFFHSLRAQAQRVPHKADSRRGEVARGRFRARSNGNQSHLTARHIFSCARLDQIACRRATCDSGGGNGGAWALRPFDGKAASTQAEPRRIGTAGP